MRTIFKFIISLFLCHFHSEKYFILSQMEIIVYQWVRIANFKVNKPVSASMLVCSDSWAMRSCSLEGRASRAPMSRVAGGLWRRRGDELVTSRAHVGVRDRDNNISIARVGPSPTRCRRGRARIDRFPRARYDLELHYQAAPNRVKCPYPPIQSDSPPF